MTFTLADDAATWDISTLGQLGIATLLILIGALLLWKFAPGAISAMKGVGDSIQSMATSIAGMKDVNDELVHELRADREQNRASLGRIETGVIDLRDRVKTLESK
jgi:hypothetical protein